MPEPTDSLHDRLAGATGLSALVAEARATWVERAERDAASGGNESPTADVAEVAAAVGVAAAETPSDGMQCHTTAATSGSARPRRPATPGWRAFEDAFPTFYQFTNRPRA